MPSFVRRALFVCLLLVTAATFYLWSRRGTETTDARSAPEEANAAERRNERPSRGGQLVATVRTEPRSFNLLNTAEPATKLVSTLTQGSLVRLNQVTQELEPWLAERWESTNDVEYVVHLRRDVTFSDGTPVTAADVVFTFKALYDEKVGSPVAEALKIGGVPIGVQARDDHTIVLTYPSAYGPGLRPLDSLPILPRHVLEPALTAGTFKEAWSAATPPAQVVGFGPFVLRTYLPGQRLELERNPRYFRVDERGERLPYLDRLTIEITPSQATEMLKLEAGEVDLISSELRPEDIPAVRQLVKAGRAQLVDLGVGPDVDILWFNLSPKGPTRAAVAGVPARPWLGAREFRQAIAQAIDREQFVNTVLLGAGTPVYGFVTPGNKQWFATDLPTWPYDRVKAGALLDGIGLRDRDNDGTRETEDGTPARFALFTQQGHTTRERAVAVIKQDLQAIGLQAEVSALERPVLLQRIMGGAYEAVYFGINATDLDPAGQLDYWSSRGAFHLWNPGQATPGTEWEREIDGLMQRMMATTDHAVRKSLFDQVQRIAATELPTIPIAASHIVIATSSRVVNAQPALLRPQILWAADTLAVRPSSTRATTTSAAASR